MDKLSNFGDKYYTIWDKYYTIKENIQSFRELNMVILGTNQGIFWTNGVWHSLIYSIILLNSLDNDQHQEVLEQIIKHRQTD